MWNECHVKVKVWWEKSGDALKLDKPEYNKIMGFNSFL